ncbi:MAG: (Fe-S)-binding protein [Rikenellaceae bacterium]|nr:(Fe-S)-binding protein [Rikenellaceae bacterium]
MEKFGQDIFVYYDHFVIPFTVGAAVLFAVVVYKYCRWFYKLPAADKSLTVKGLFSAKVFGAVGEVISESLLHRRIFRVNPLLGYMHMSLALGWFLLIVVGWIEASMHLREGFAPLHAHVFYKYFAPAGGGTSAERALSDIMDLLLLFVLSGVALAWFKRLRSRALGMRRTTKHVLGDKVALTALWFIFPVRLLAESAEAGLKGIPSFLTGNLGEWMVSGLGVGFVEGFSTVMWWIYSIVLAVFFVAMPFSRYMHIFTEIPLIFLRQFGLKSREGDTTFDHFQIEACSRCGICIDPCQLQADAGISGVQSVYFLRDRRYHRLSREVAANCLMCGRCEAKCPVGIELDTLRQNSRAKFSALPADDRYGYLGSVPQRQGGGRVGYFAGCMTLLTPRILRSMEKIFDASGQQVWWADREGGICCGRPLKLSGEIEAARRMMQYNRELFTKQQITTLVTSCPICLRVFREDYRLEGIEVLHHSQYILRLLDQGLISVEKNQTAYTYHDPCELGRGCGIYDQPRELIRRTGTLSEASENREDSPCCGASLANLEIGEPGQQAIARAAARRYKDTGASVLVTSCPLCKKTIGRAFGHSADIAEIVAGSIVQAG